MLLRQIFDPALAQSSYLVGCQKTGEALLIDPQRDIDRYVRLASENSLRITAVAETHIHADFVSGSQTLAITHPKATVYLSAEGGQDEWSYRWPSDHSNVTFLHHKDRFFIGKIEIQAMHTPGHTPEHLSFLITDRGGGVSEPIALASGDFLFVGDVGRPDLLETAAGVSGAREAGARALWHSIEERLPGLPDYLQILPGHGAGSACGKALGAIPTSVLGYERRFNRAFLLAGKGEDAFVEGILADQPDPPPYFARMKKVNQHGIGRSSGPKKLRRLRAADFAALAGGETAIFDIRRDRAEFMRAHAPGAIHAPLGSPLFAMAAGSYLDTDSRIVLVAPQESDAEEAARQLYRIGLDEVARFVIAEDVNSSRATETVNFSEWDFKAIGGDAAILDVRNTGEFAERHLPGAISVPYTQLRSRLAEIPEKGKLYVHCATGRRAAVAASWLESMGRQVVFVDGDFSATAA